MVLIRIAIVEDEPTERDRIKVYLEEIAQEDQTQFDIEQYSSGMAFVMRGMKDYDLVLMDIDMPNLNGIETAKALRKVDQSATLIFVTNMAQYAISGYEVNAVDFILKPVNRYSFAIKINPILEVDLFVCQKFCAFLHFEVCIQVNGCIRNIDGKGELSFFTMSCKDQLFIFNHDLLVVTIRKDTV